MFMIRIRLTNVWRTQLCTYKRRFTSRGTTRKDAKRTARSFTFVYLQPNFDERRPCLHFSHHLSISCLCGFKRLVCFNVVFISCRPYVVFSCDFSLLYCYDLHFYLFISYVLVCFSLFMGPS